jgi:hypothetical protein
MVAVPAFRDFFWLEMLLVLSIQLPAMAYGLRYVVVSWLL